MRIPRWSMRREPAGDGELLVLAWDDPVFQLPVPVRVGTALQRVEMPAGRGSLPVPAGAEVAVDPEGWLLALPAP
jgi:hypothetical protein